jgi:hypothetical protein
LSYCRTGSIRKLAVRQGGSYRARRRSVARNARRQPVKAAAAVELTQATSAPPVPTCARVCNRWTFCSSRSGSSSALCAASSAASRTTRRRAPQILTQSTIRRSRACRRAAGPRRHRRPTDVTRGRSGRASLPYGRQLMSLVCRLVSCPTVGCCVLCLVRLIYTSAPPMLCPLSSAASAMAEVALHRRRGRRPVVRAGLFLASEGASCGGPSRCAPPSGLPGRSPPGPPGPSRRTTGTARRLGTETARGGRRVNRRVRCGVQSFRMHADIVRAREKRVPGCRGRNFCRAFLPQCAASAHSSRHDAPAVSGCDHARYGKETRGLPSSWRWRPTWPRALDRMRAQWWQRRLEHTVIGSLTFRCPPADEIAPLLWYARGIQMGGPVGGATQRGRSHR